MNNYKTVFDGVESTLLRIGSSNLPYNQIKESLDAYKRIEEMVFSDEDYYWILVYVIFYSGFRASTVTKKHPIIRHHFPSYVAAASYGEDEIEKILGDHEMISNRRKVRSCVKNARVLEEIIAKFGSFHRYIDSFAPRESFEGLMLLKEELEYIFEGLGRITTYHFLTDIGLPILKPDRVIRRIFYRLGFLDDEGQLLKTVIQGRGFAQATGHPIRYIDIVFVAYGQMQSNEFGIEKGICLKEMPNCSICGVSQYCRYYSQRTSV